MPETILQTNHLNTKWLISNHFNLFSFETFSHFIFHVLFICSSMRYRGIEWSLFVLTKTPCSCAIPMEIMMMLMMTTAIMRKLFCISLCKTSSIDVKFDPDILNSTYLLGRKRDKKRRKRL